MRWKTNEWPWSQPAHVCKRCHNIVIYQPGHDTRCQPRRINRWLV